MVVPYVPGGLPDTMGRIVAQRMGEAFRRAVVSSQQQGVGHHDASAGRQPKYAPPS